MNKSTIQDVDDSSCLILGIETSCDETAAAVVAADRTVHAARVHSQIEDHRAFGGVVPEIAARAHVHKLTPVIEGVMRDARLSFTDLAGVAVTAGPGLIGGLVVGIAGARAIADAADLPLYGINHLEAHALTVRMLEPTAFPYLLLLVSGGHCQFLAVRGVGRYRRLGSTIDDAVGEAFDKVAKMLGLGFPGGPAVEAAARRGDPTRFALPRPLLGQAGCNVSFSGLKTAVRTLTLRLGDGVYRDETLADLCAGFQEAVADVLADRTANALAQFDALHPAHSESLAAHSESLAAHSESLAARSERPANLVVAGGVAANARIRQRLASQAEWAGARLTIPPPRLCTDNAEMVAWAGLERLMAGELGDHEVGARARWPLDPDAEPLLGAGTKGTKA